MKRLIPVALALFVWAPANGQVQINRWQDLKPYIAQQTDAINDHGEKLRYQQALIDKLIATVDQQRLWILDFACKWNGLNEQLSKARAVVEGAEQPAGRRTADQGVRWGESRATVARLHRVCATGTDDANRQFQSRRRSGWRQLVGGHHRRQQVARDRHGSLGTEHRRGPVRRSEGVGDRLDMELRRAGAARDSGNELDAVQGDNQHHGKDVVARVH